MVKRELCPNCNAQLIRLGNGKLYCESCQSTFDDASMSDAEIPLLASASKLLRDGRFEEADDAFRDIISEFPHNYEAYYGRALAKHGIVFVSDLRAGMGKKVPTCYITDIGSFIDDPNYKKAIQFAPDEIGEEYKKQGQLIENIISEWKDKASKEDYDVFISFKASEDDTGEETKDLIEATKLYTFLVGKKLKVFFSPVTLKSYTSERYEPYIFNAINQAPVMIVYGQSQSHMEATWVRNEWSRFIKKIQTGEKLANSLMVCYEKMSSKDLPNEFKSIQCIDCSEHTAYIEILEHIQKVLDQAKTPTSQIETIQTEYGKVGKKATKMNYEEIKTYRLGSATVEKVTKTDELILESARKYFAHGMNEKCLEALEQFLENNEYNYEAQLLKLYATYNCKSIETLITAMKKESDLKHAKFLISLASKEDALTMIDCLYEKLKQLFLQDHNIWKYIFSILVELDFPKNKEMRRFVVDEIVEFSEIFRDCFDDYIKYIDNNDIKYHVDIRLKLIEKYIGVQGEEDFCLKYINEVKEIDEGNALNIKYKMCLDLGIKNDSREIINAALEKQDIFFENLETTFKFSEKKEAIEILTDYINILLDKFEAYDNEKETDVKMVVEIPGTNSENGITPITKSEYFTAKCLQFFDNLIKYIPIEETKKIVSILERVTNILCCKEMFESCILYCNILLNYAPEDKKDDVILLILKCRARYSVQRKFPERYCIDKLDNFDEWNVLLTFEKSSVEKEMFSILDAQGNYEAYKAKLIEERKEKEKAYETSAHKMRSAKRLFNLSRFLPAFLSIILTLAVCGFVFFCLYKCVFGNESVARILINIYAALTFTGLAFALFSINKALAKITITIDVLGCIAHVILFCTMRERFDMSQYVNLWIAAGATVILCFLVAYGLYRIPLSKRVKKKEKRYLNYREIACKSNDRIYQIDKHFSSIDKIIENIESNILSDKKMIAFKKTLEDR